MFLIDSYLARRRGERLRAVRIALLSIAVLALVALPAGYFMLRRFERAVTFHPERKPLGGVWRVPEGGEDVWFKTADGTRLHGWFVRASKQPAAATVIYFHGNGGNISYLGWVGESLAARGNDVLLFDYRGYGRSEGEVTDERGLYADADAAYDYVVKERGVRPDSLTLYGQSLGTTAVADLAARRECRAIILESGLSSAEDMAALILPWFPRSLFRFTRNKLDSARKLAHVRCPVLVAHGDRDEVIPLSQGRVLYAAAPEPKRLIVVQGAGHNDLYGIGGEKYLDAVVAFIRDSSRPLAPVEPH